MAMLPMSMPVACCLQLLTGEQARETTAQCRVAGAKCLHSQNVYPKRLGSKLIQIFINYSSAYGCVNARHHPKPYSLSFVKQIPPYFRRLSGLDKNFTNSKLCLILIKQIRIPWTSIDTLLVFLMSKSNHVTFSAPSAETSEAFEAIPRENRQDVEGDERLPFLSRIVFHDPLPKLEATFKKVLAKESVFIHAVDIDILDFLTDMDALKSDINGIFISEEDDSNGISGFHIAEKMGEMRQSLPLFMRVSCKERLKDPELIEKAKRCGISHLYSLDDQTRLRSLLETFVIGSHYPVKLIDGIRALAYEVIDGFFPDRKVTSRTPYLVADYLMREDLSAILPFFSQIGSGYIMVQTNEDPLKQAAPSKTADLSNRFRTSTIGESILGEVANLLWGKLHFVLQNMSTRTPQSFNTNIPIVVNKNQEHIIFGSNKPQICFKYAIASEYEAHPIIISMKIIFHSFVAPESIPDFAGAIKAHEDIAGDIELF